MTERAKLVTCNVGVHQPAASFLVRCPVVVDRGREHCGAHVVHRGAGGAQASQRDALMFALPLCQLLLLVLMPVIKRAARRGGVLQQLLLLLRSSTT